MPLNRVTAMRRLAYGSLARGSRLPIVVALRASLSGGSRGSRQGLRALRLGRPALFFVVAWGGSGSAVDRRSGSALSACIVFTSSVSRVFSPQKNRSFFEPPFTLF